MTTIMLPFHSVYTHRFKKRIELRTQEQPLVAEHRGGTNSRMKRPQLHPPHTRGIPVIAGRSHFTRKNTRFRAPASSPKQSPCNIHAAITLRFAASRSKPASLSTHMATPDDSNRVAICNYRFKTRIEPRTQEQPLVAEHRGGTNLRMKRPQLHPPHTRGIPVIADRKPL